MKPLAVLGGCLALHLTCMSAAAPAQSVTYEFDQQRSDIFVVTHRKGLLSFLGHEHSILVTNWTGTLCWTAGDPVQGYGGITADAHTLVIDSDSARALAGLGGGPSPDQVATLQKKLLDARHLDAERHPTITLDRVAVAFGTGLQWTAQARLIIKGVSRDVLVPLTIAETDTTLRMTGKLTVAQSEFGIKPESIALVVKVADPVDIHFDLLARPTEQRCRQ